MRSLGVFLSIGVVAAVLPLAPAWAEWTPGGRTNFRQSCTSSCQQGDVTKAVPCSNYCVCMTIELEKAYPDMRLFIRLNETKDPAYIQRARGIDQACSNR